MDIFSFIQNAVNVFDYGYSFLTTLFTLPFFDGVEYVFSTTVGANVLEFPLLINGGVMSFTFPKLPVVSDLVGNLFTLLYGWAPTIFGDIGFGLCIVLGTICNVFVFTLLHWLIKFVKL